MVRPGSALACAELLTNAEAAEREQRQRTAIGKCPSFWFGQTQLSFDLR
jgi:hypothetical protein